MEVKRFSLFAKNSNHPVPAARDRSQGSGWIVGTRQLVSPVKDTADAALIEVTLALVFNECPREDRRPRRVPSARR